MTKREAITQDYLKSRLNYDPETGVFRWKLKRGCRAAGQVAGCTKDDKDGWPYIVIRVNNHLYYAHRLAFFYMTGRYPDRADHRNGDTLDNRWRNLREATNAQNAMNSKTANNNTSGHKGVDWHKRAGKWRARIKLEGREKY